YDAKLEGRRKARVEIEFSHDGKNYIAHRDFAGGGYAGRTAGARLTLLEVVKSGVEPVPNAEQILKNILPEEMADHFLFDGEWAEAIVGSNNSRVIGGAVRNILGCELLTRAVGDLRRAEKAFRSKITAKADDQLTQYQRDANVAEKAIETAKEGIKNADTREQAAQLRVQVLDREIGTFQAAKVLHDQRLKAEARLKRLQSEFEQLTAKLTDLTAKMAAPMVSGKACDTANQYIDVEEVKGRLPEPYNKEFIEDLLDRALGICGADLSEATKARETVKSLINKGADKVLRDRLKRITMQ
ncbi:MAG: hypothetical protein CFE32_21050, partial [Alphaproteobacteria bacterium PA3]